MFARIRRRGRRFSRYSPRRGNGDGAPDQGSDAPSLVGGAMIVVLLALTTEMIFVVLEKLLVSAGVRRH